MSQKSTPKLLKICTTSMLKREREKAKEYQDTLNEIYRSLPKLTFEEARRRRLNLHEAVCIELEEKGYRKAAFTIKKLTDHQNEMRDASGPDSLISSKPLLATNQEALQKLKIELSAAEAAENSRLFLESWEIAIRLAAYFAFQPEDDWWWIGEILLTDCLEEIEESNSPETAKFEAVLRFFFGKYLIENVHKDCEALPYLNKARKLSEGKEWTPKKFLSTKTGTIYEECNVLLYKVYWTESKKYLNIDPVKALGLAKEARARAKEACNAEAETEALMVQGVCEMINGDTGSAVTTLTKTLVAQVKSNKIEASCETRINLALAYLKSGNTLKALKHLTAVKTSAEQSSLPFFIAQAYRYMGEFYLEKGEPKIATPLLVSSLSLFLKTSGARTETQQTRILTAISQGLESINKYTEVILKAALPGEAGRTHMANLCKWKDCRAKFWLEEKTAIALEDNKSFEDLSISIGEEELEELKQELQNEEAAGEETTEVEEKEEMNKKEEIKKKEEKRDIEEKTEARSWESWNLDDFEEDEADITSSNT